jgi:hypothetical protein
MLNVTERQTKVNEKAEICNPRAVEGYRMTDRKRDDGIGE